MTCKNCGATFEGKFCSSCGQKADIHRITMKHFVHELFHAMTHTDKGILLLAKSLVTRPGHVAREYLDGKRATYFNPLSFLVITTALYAYVSYQTGYFSTMSNSGASGQPRTGQVREVPEWVAEFFRIMGEANQISIHNGKILALFLIFPLLAFFTWLLFKRSKTNFAENLVFSSFLMGQSNLLLTFIFIPAFLIAPETVRINNNVYHLVFLVYMIVAYRQFFKQNIFLTILKSFLVMILYIIFFWLLIVAYVAVKHLIVGG